MDFRNFLKKTFLKKTPSLEIQELRKKFKKSYLSFKELLRANNRALEIITDLEEKLEGDTFFGMDFIRSKTTEVSAQVYKTILNLNSLSSEKYKELYDIFSEIKIKIQQELKRFYNIELLTPSSVYPLVVNLNKVTQKDASLVGNKMANLGEIKNRLKIKTPDGFVITTVAYKVFLEKTGLDTEIARRIQVFEKKRTDDLFRLSSWLQDGFLKAPIPVPIQKELKKELQKLKESLGSHHVKFILRSSATGEDREDISFAGQYRSVLNISEDSILYAYREVLASLYNFSAMRYRYLHGIVESSITMAVGCLVMLFPVSGGVLYTSDPLNINNKNIIIHSTWGLPKGIVDGKIEFDEFVVSRQFKIIKKLIRCKTKTYIPSSTEGAMEVYVDDFKKEAPSISDEQIILLSKIALNIEKHFGRPQDIEWIIDRSGTIFILQTRPLKILSSLNSTVEKDFLKEKEVIARGGITVYKGIGSGRVFFLKKYADILQVPDKAIVVAQQALPVWASVLEKASALVVEEGSPLCHLANVAREFNIPAIFGFKDITKILKPNEIVTVDATNRIIYKGKIIFEQEKRNLFMKNTPIYEILKRICTHITPLNLLDPDSIKFKIQNCQTYHDILRFCHEMAVKEMFSFGEKHSFYEKGSKRLVCNVPMQFWVINLNDGFKREVNEDFVRIEDISCKPMLIIWKGMVSIPWEGPPPVDAKGFLSVLHEATINPWLEESHGSLNFAIKNYFMISKEFCSLQSKFGFHFSTLETLVGERKRENYILFKFKGGAANLERRILRAKFVEDILENFGFRCKVKQDYLMARIEGYEEDKMLEKLLILGYLIIHTRQLDMIMHDPDMVKIYTKKILKDINNLLKTGVNNL